MNLKTAFPIISIFCLLFSAGRAVWADEIGISAELSRAAMAFEEKDTLTVRLSWEGEPFLYQIDSFPMPRLEKLQILGSSSMVATGADSAAAGGQATVRVYRYILEPLDYGTGVIQPLQITATHRTTGEIRLLQTALLTVEIAKPVPREDRGGFSYLLIVLAAVVVGGTAIFLVWWLRRRRAPAEPKDRSYLETLEMIRRETVADRKLFYSRLYRLLVGYLEKEAGLSLAGKTGQEAITEVRSLDKFPDRDIIVGWLERIQEEKYRPAAPAAGEVDGMFNAVYSFFESKISS